MLQLSIASGTSRAPASPLVHNWLSADKHCLLGPRLKDGRRHQAMLRVLRNITESEADVMNLGDLKLVGRWIAADREDDQRRPADAAWDGRLKVLQGHVIAISIALGTITPRCPPLARRVGSDRPTRSLCVRVPPLDALPCETAPRSLVVTAGVRSGMFSPQVALGSSRVARLLHKAAPRRRRTYRISSGTAAASSSIRAPVRRAQVCLGRGTGG